MSQQYRQNIMRLAINAVAADAARKEGLAFADCREIVQASIDGTLGQPERQKAIAAEVRRVAATLSRPLLVK